MPVATIISAIAALVGTGVSVAGAAKSSREAKEAAEKEREFASGEAKKNRASGIRAANLSGLERLGGQRAQAAGRAVTQTSSAFASDIMKAARKKTAARQAPQAPPPPQGIGRFSQPQIGPKNVRVGQRRLPGGVL